MNAIKIFACSSLFTSPASLLARYASKMRPNKNNNGSMQPVKFAARNRLLQSLVSLAGAFIGISAIGYVTFHFSVPLMLAPFGASVVLLFSVYDSPLAQPRNTVLGHVLAALIGGMTAVIHSTYFGGSSNILGSESYMWIAASVAVSIAAMQVLRLTHPPAGATAFIASATIKDMGSLAAFMIPIAAGASILVALTILFNNVIPSRRYPSYW